MGELKTVPTVPENLRWAIVKAMFILNCSSMQPEDELQEDERNLNANIYPYKGYKSRQPDDDEHPAMEEEEETPDPTPRTPRGKSKRRGTSSGAPPSNITSKLRCLGLDGP